MRQITTNEEKVAKTLVYAVNDVTLDLVLVGEYVSQIADNVLYTRLDVVMDTARQEREYGYTFEKHQERAKALG